MMNSFVWNATNASFINRFSRELVERKERVKSSIINSFIHWEGARCIYNCHSQFILSYDLYKSVNYLSMLYSFINYGQNLWITIVTTII